MSGLTHAVVAIAFPRAALAVRVAAVAPDAGALLMAVLRATLAVSREDVVARACAFVAGSGRTVFSGLG